MHCSDMGEFYLFREVIDIALSALLSIPVMVLRYKYTLLLLGKLFSLDNNC